MIKGINKQIVEINYTRSDYIEKAILIINPQKSALPAPFIAQKAEQYVDEVRQNLQPSAAREAAGRKRSRSLLQLGLLLIGLGAAVTALALLWLL